MGRVTKGYEVDREELDTRSPSDSAREAIRRRQIAASHLRAARLTDDASERAELRRLAAQLLSPRRGPRR
jgi:hypothetical protein